MRSREQTEFADAVILGLAIGAGLAFAITVLVVLLA